MRHGQSIVAATERQSTLAFLEVNPAWLQAPCLREVRKLASVSESRRDKVACQSMFKVPKQRPGMPGAGCHCQAMRILLRTNTAQQAGTCSINQSGICPSPPLSPTCLSLLIACSHGHRLPPLRRHQGQHGCSPCCPAPAHRHLLWHEGLRADRQHACRGAGASAGGPHRLRCPCGPAPGGHRGQVRVGIESQGSGLDADGPPSGS